MIFLSYAAIMGGAGARQRAKTLYPGWGRGPVGGAGGECFGSCLESQSLATGRPSPAQPGPALAYSRDQTFA